MNYILFDDSQWASLLPFTHTRPAADIRCGIFTIRERWEYLLKATTSTLARQPLQAAYPVAAAPDSILLNGRVTGQEDLVTAIRSLAAGERLMKGDTIIAARPDGSAGLDIENLETLHPKQYAGEINELKIVTDIFSKADQGVRDDFALLSQGRASAPPPEGVTVSGKDNLLIHPGARIAAGVVLNAVAGPIYIAQDAEIMEGCLIRGPFALCEGATLKMGAKVYGGTVIGPGCKVGGEVSNAVFFANSNKGHDGFLGNAVIGEWCNLGADTNCSNLKNNYDEVKIWDEAQMKSVKTGLTFCGLLMGDHSKCGINTMFNTGTVVGVSCNIWGGGFPEKFVPSFSWGGPDGMTTYSFGRAAETANRMMARRNKSLSAAESDVLQNVFDKTKAQRDLLHSS